MSRKRTETASVLSHQRPRFIFYLKKNYLMLPVLSHNTTIAETTFGTFAYRTISYISHYNLSGIL